MQKPEPLVAIVGRPNVGKSTLFNRILKASLSIVELEPGVTRDRVYGATSWNGKDFYLVDTGGITLRVSDKIKEQINIQVDLAIKEANVIIFLTDYKEGLSSVEEELALMLRKSKKHLFLVVNKVDNMKEADDIYDFYKLGMDNIIPVSAMHGLNINKLLDEITKKIPKAEKKPKEDWIKVAVVGRPNVGKSSFVNKLLREERVIVDEAPGTTRDSVDTFFHTSLEGFMLIDTAGIRKTRQITKKVEIYSVSRAERSIRRSDVALLLIDAEEGITRQDSRIARYIVDKGKGIIILVNKWDLVSEKGEVHRDYYEYVRTRLPFVKFAPILFVSAKTGLRVFRTPEIIKQVFDSCSTRISTSILNKAVENMKEKYHPPAVRGRKLSLLYVTQVKVKPPTFTFFINDSQLIKESYINYIGNKLREDFTFFGTPIRMYFRER